MIKMFKERIKDHHRKKNGQLQKASEGELFNFLKNSPKDKDGVIYFHIPFCDNICSFCSMNRTKLKYELDSYTKYLLSQIDKYSNTNYFKEKNIESIFFGGGTPTVLKEKHLEKILTAINNKFNISKTCEFSFETTLHNLSLSKLKLMQELGVNRYSVGIQTFNSKGRKLLNRIFDESNTISKLEQIRANFDGMLCIDIIYNYPDQNIKDVIKDANIIKNLKIDSASFYSLMFTEGSVLSKNISKDYYNLQTDKKLHHAFAASLLDSGDYEFLEHTKIVRKNRDKYKYIIMSHQGKDILPIGIGAGGKIGDFSIFSMNKDKKIIFKTSKISKKQAKFINLFQYPRVDFNTIKSFLKEDTFNKLLVFFKECEKYGYLNIKDNSYKLNIEGIFWGNTIANQVENLTIKDFK